MGYITSIVYVTTLFGVAEVLNDLLAVLVASGADVMVFSVVDVFVVANVDL